MLTVETPVVTVPRLWPDATIVVLASGPSLTADDIALCRDRPDTHILAIKDSIRLAPWAPVLYACDRRWWRTYPGTKNLTARKYGLEALRERPDVQILRQGPEMGLSLDPTALALGRNSGHQAINLAVHLGARRILLLGFDMQTGVRGKVHWFGDHPYGTPPPPFYDFRERLATLVAPLRAQGIEILNCTPGSALECFEQRPWREALA
jgi:hypothetical protein